MLLNGFEKTTMLCKGTSANCRLTDYSNWSSRYPVFWFRLPSILNWHQRLRTWERQVLSRYIHRFWGADMSCVLSRRVVYCGRSRTSVSGLPLMQRQLHLPILLLHVWWLFLEHYVDFPLLWNTVPFIWTCMMHCALGEWCCWGIWYGVLGFLYA